MGNFTEFDFPPVLGADGQPITVEESEQGLRALPTFIPFDGEYMGKPVQYSIACNLDNVDDKAVSEYELFKNERAAIFRTKPAKVTNGKAVASDDDGPTGAQLVASAKLRPRERQLFLNLLFPHDWEQNPVVLGSNCPNVPKDRAEMKAWFERGGVTQSVIIEEVVMKIDPTGPLADAKEREGLNKKLYEKMEQTMHQKLQEIEELDVSKALGREIVVEPIQETEYPLSSETNLLDSEANQDWETLVETEAEQETEQESETTDTTPLPSSPEQ